MRGRDARPRDDDLYRLRTQSRKCRAARHYDGSSPWATRELRETTEEHDAALSGTRDARYAGRRALTTSASGGAIHTRWLRAAAYIFATPIIAPTHWHNEQEAALDAS